MSETTTVRGYADSESTERWFGAFETREEAIKEGTETYANSPCFWIISGSKPSPSEFVPTVDFIIEQMGESANDEAGDAAEEFPQVGLEGRNVLEFLLSAWAEKYAPVHFWTVSGVVERIDLRAAEG